MFYFWCVPIALNSIYCALQDSELAILPYLLEIMRGSDPEINRCVDIGKRIALLTISPQF